MRLSGSTAVVTGGGSGIGRAFVLRLAAEGASVVVADIDDRAADAVTEEVSRAGGRALAAPCDVTVRSSVDEAVAATLAEFGSMEVFFNNAGIAGYATLLEVDDAVFRRTMDINVLGMIHGMQAAAAHMIERGRGKIVNTGSIAGKSPHPGSVVYSASKSAVHAVTEGFAKELAPHGVTVNAICPGMVDTPLWDDADTEYAARGLVEPGTRVVATLAPMIPLGRISVPEDLTGLAVFLASSDSDYMTAQSINLDGGITSI